MRHKSASMKGLANRHKRVITIFQQKSGLSDDQVLWVTFAKGVIVGLCIAWFVF